MARTKIPEPERLQSWDDVNAALKEIAAAEIVIAQIEGDMNIKINSIKESADRECAPLRAQIADIGKQIKLFAELNRPNFGKAKTKALTFGQVGFRQSTSVVVKSALTAKIIDNLRKLGMSDCIKQTETVNKEILKTYPAEQIIAAGASFKKSDTFWYETDKTSLMPDKG